MLHTMVLSLSKWEQSSVSNQGKSINSNCGALREDEIVHWLLENAKNFKVDSELSNVTQDEVVNHHAFSFPKKKQ